MKQTGIIYAALIFVMACCNTKKNTKTAGEQKSSNLPSDIPLCLQQKIDSFAIAKFADVPLEIFEYDQNGKKRYYFIADCCDRFNEVYDDNCVYICSPAGGIAGAGDLKCPDFFKQATKLRLIWKKEP